MEKFRPLLAEFIGTFALIFVGIGAIKTAGHDTLGIALAHGLTIGAFVCATLHISGGNFNPAVTFGLLCGGHTTLDKALGFWAAQLLGGFTAAPVFFRLFRRGVGGMGTPPPRVHLHGMQGILVEAILTFFLVFVICGTAVDQRSRGAGVAGFAIGATITLDILFGGPLTGAAMNPARVFGPALASWFWHDHYVYWIGPLIGGALGGYVYGLLYERKSSAT